MRGGVKWREGVDTCVFNPPVACADGTAIPEGSVSRIRMTARGARDLFVEDKIKSIIAALPEGERPFLENGVVIYAAKCTPSYTAADVGEAPDFEFRDRHGCSKLDGVREGADPRHTNLLTPQWGETVYDYMFPNDIPEKTRIENWRGILRNAIIASAALVPDAGPWVIHADCHFGNVLIRGNPTESGINDWGRTIVIENPNDLASVRRGIVDWAKALFRQPPADADIPDIIRGLGDMRQHPQFILDDVSDIFVPYAGVSELNALKKTLRGWVPYVLVTQAVRYYNHTHNPKRDVLYHPPTGRTIDPAALLHTENQTLLAGLCSQILESEPQPRAGGMYWPAKYFKGLTRKQNLQRKRSATRRTKMSFKDPKAYVPFKSDKGVKTRRSSYTERFHKKYPGAKSLAEIAKATGVSKSVLDEVYNRGMAAWRTGHRPGASQHAWGMARVHSFVMKGKTYHTADADLAKRGRT